MMDAPSVQMVLCTTCALWFENTCGKLAYLRHRNTQDSQIGCMKDSRMSSGTKESE